MLSKFPVTTDRGEYRVTIRKTFEVEDIDVIYNVDVHKPYVKWRLFRRFKLVKTYNAGESYRNQFIDAATNAVKMYEDYEDEIAEKDAEKNEAIEAFRNWDGNITKEESE